MKKRPTVQYVSVLGLQIMLMSKLSQKYHHTAEPHACQANVYCYSQIFIYLSKFFPTEISKAGVSLICLDETKICRFYTTNLYARAFHPFAKSFLMLFFYFDSNSHLGPILITAEIFKIVIEALTKP